MSNLGTRDFAYRAFRLRRLIGVAAALPLPSLGLAMLAQAPVGGWLALIWFGVVVFHVLRFPNAWLELIALSLTLAIPLLAAPIGGNQGIAWWLGYPLALVVGFPIWLALSTGLHWLERFPWPFEVAPLRKHLRISPEAAREALFLRPNATIGTFRCGPADNDGNFQVTVDEADDPAEFNLSELEFGDLAGLDLGADGATKTATDSEEDTFSFLAKVVHSDALSQEVLAVRNPGRETQDVQTLIQTLEPAAGGCRYEKVENGDVMGGISGLGFWLTDADADDLTATLDQAAGRRSRALRDAHHETLIGQIGQFVRQKMAERQMRRTTEA